MLEEKTKGNLTGEERQFLDQILYELRMRFVAVKGAGELSVAMRPARVFFLGTGTSHGVPMIGCRCAVCTSDDPRDRRLRPSIYLDVEGGPGLLVDTATDLRQQALAHHLRRVDALLYTHSHADHVMGIDEMRRFNALRQGAIPVYADAPTAADLRRMFGYAFAPPRTPRAAGCPNWRSPRSTGRSRRPGCR